MAVSVAGARAGFPGHRFNSGGWIERLARLGYAAKGVVYVVIGGIALQVALGRRSETEGSSGALVSIAGQPAGRVVIAIVAAGLLGYALWKLVQGVVDPEHKGSDAKGRFTRLGYIGSGVIHAGLTIEAIRLALGSTLSGDDEAGVDSRTAMLMEQPFGRWLLGLAGLGVLAFALHQAHRATDSKVAKRLNLGDVDPDTRRWIVRAGRIGSASRAVVFAIIGYFIVQAALEYDPAEARGVGDALETLREQPYGPWVLGLVALGLIGYGFFAFVKAGYRRIQAP